MNARAFRRRQHGTSLVVAIFLVVIIASLAAFAVTVGTASRQSANLQLQADRAWAAAEAGVEWGAYRALRQGACPFGPTVVNLNASGMPGFRVTVSCTAQMHAEGATNYRVYDVDSFAQWSNFGAAGYASRRVSRRFSDAP